MHCTTFHFGNVLATSVPSERLFSTEGLVVSKL